MNDFTDPENTKDAKVKDILCHEVIRQHVKIAHEQRHETHLKRTDSLNG